MNRSHTISKLFYTFACALCVGCGSNDPSRADYSGSIGMNILVVVVVAVIGGVAWLAGKISGDDK